MHNDVSSKDIQKEIYPHKEIRDDHQQRNKSFDPWKEAALEKVKKDEPFQKEKVLEVVKALMEMGREHGGWLKHMSPEGVKIFLKKGGEYGGWLKHMSSEDIQTLTAMVKQDRSLLYHFCSEDLEALAQRQRAYGDRVESGRERGKEPFDAWIERARDQYGKPVERTVNLATESTLEKPLLLGKGKDLDDFLSKDTSFLSDCRRKEIIGALKKGGSLEKIFKSWEKQQYKDFNIKQGTNSQSSSREGSSQRDWQPSRDEGTNSRDNEPNIPIGHNLYFRERYAYTTSTKPYQSYLPGSCAINVTMTLLRLHGFRPELMDVASGLGYPASNIYKGGSDPNKVIDVLEKFSTSTIRYEERYSKMDSSEMQKILERGPILAGFETSQGNHIIMVERIESNSQGTFVCIIDPQPNDASSYKIPIEEWFPTPLICCYIPIEEIDSETRALKQKKHPSSECCIL